MRWEIVWMYLPCFMAAIFGLLWVLAIMLRDYRVLLKKQLTAAKSVTEEAATKQN